MDNEIDSLSKIQHAVSQAKKSIEELEKEIEALNRVIRRHRVFDNLGEALTIGDDVTFVDRVALPGSDTPRSDVTGTVCDITEHFVHVEVLRHNHSTQVTQRKIVRRASRNLVKIGRGFDVRNFDLF